MLSTRVCVEKDVLNYLTFLARRRLDNDLTTEEELKAKGTAYKAGSFPFMANARAKALGFPEGSVKILADQKTDRILGVHVLGPRASDMIAEAVIAMLKNRVRL